MPSRISNLNFKYLGAVVVLTLMGTFEPALSQTKRVLFLGNSYTSWNGMPQTVADIATSMGDTLIFDSNTPGGYPMGYHVGDSNSVRKVREGIWDYVSLQDQSQFPAMKNYRMLYSIHMDSLVKQYNPCATSLFYMTWGRKNGDGCTPDWPYTCSYMGMDSLLRLRYMQMGEVNKAEVSPVGAVWRYIRQQYPNIELYQSDESHPSSAGSYAAACTFYTAIFRKDPRLISFDANLPAQEAAEIRLATGVVVYDSLLNWGIGKYDTLKDSATCYPLPVDPPPAFLGRQLYPNPVDHLLTLELQAEFMDKDLYIYNSNGSRMMKVQLNETSQVNVSKLPQGMYYIRASGDKSKALRFVKR